MRGGRGCKQKTRQKTVKNGLTAEKNHDRINFTSAAGAIQCACFAALTRAEGGSKQPL